MARFRVQKPPLIITITASIRETQQLAFVNCEHGLIEFCCPTIVVSARDENGNTMLATIDKVVPGSTGSEIPTPNTTECAIFSTIPVGTGVNQSVIVNNFTESVNRMDKPGARRLTFSRKLGGETLSAKELSQAAESAYPENKIAGGWTVWHECRNDNAVARFMYKVGR